MTNKHLATYLNDHLSGAVGAIELLEHLSKWEGQPGRTLASVRDEVKLDRDALRGIMDKLHVAESPVRKAAGWIAHAAAQLKLRLDDPSASRLYRVEALEAVSLGIEGKLAGWKSLEAIVDAYPAIQSVDFGALQGRAAAQRSRIEALRLEAGREAFVTA